MKIELRVEDMEAVRKSLKIGGHVKYMTEIKDDKPGHVQYQAIDAIVIKKFRHVALVEYLVPCGRSWKPTQRTITYREILFQERGLDI